MRRYIRQPEGSNLCGQTCVAMIADIPLEESITAFGKRSCTTTKDVIKALRSLGISCGDSLISLKKQEKTPTCMVVLHFEGAKHTHWTIYHDGLYYDPASGIGSGYPAGVRETSFLPVEYARAEEVAACGS